MGTIRTLFNSSSPLKVAALGLALIALTPAAIDAQTYLLQMPTIEVAPGDPFALALEGDWIEPVKGFQLSVEFSTTAPVENLDITVDNSLVGALEPEFIQFNVDPVQGWIVGGVLFEILIPFDGIVLPSVGFPLLIAEITGTVSEAAPQEIIAFSFLDGLGSPPVNNTFIVEFASVTPQEITNGGLDVRHPPVVIIPQFIRGDVNRDSLLDIGDVIFHLSYTFSGGPQPLCLDAGDANDDGHSNVSDAIFLLSYHFAGGPAPWPPFPGPGPDATSDNIGCEEGL
jgi:hypothetical protein